MERGTILDKVKDAQTGGTNTTLIQSEELVNGCMRFRDVKGLNISGVMDCSCPARRLSRITTVSPAGAIFFCAPAKIRP